MKKIYLVPVEVEVTPKETGKWSVSMGGHVNFVDDETEETEATAWICGDGYRTYYGHHDNVTVNVRSDKAIFDLIEKDIQRDLKDGVFRGEERKGEDLDRLSRISKEAQKKQRELEDRILEDARKQKAEQVRRELREDLNPKNRDRTHHLSDIPKISAELFDWEHSSRNTNETVMGLRIEEGGSLNLPSWTGLAFKGWTDDQKICSWTDYPSIAMALEYRNGEYFWLHVYDHRRPKGQVIP